MTKQIPIEFYNHLRNVREARERQAHVLSRRPYPFWREEYWATVQAYETTICFRNILEREQLNQETER